MKERILSIDRFSQIIMEDITPDIKKLVMSPSPEAIIKKWKELEEDLNKYKLDNPGYDDDWYMHDHFNNWYMNLPNKAYGESISNNGSRYEEAEKINIPYKDAELKRFDNPSPLFLNQTPKEFLATVNASLFFGARLSLESILSLNDENILKKDRDYANINRYTLPAFVRLLAVGYTVNDLIQ